LADRLREEVERQVPSATGHFALTELSTPVSTRHFMNSGHGEIYGISATPARFIERGLGARTPIRGLYLTGQDVASLGVAGALMGGVISASAMLGKNLLSTVSKQVSSE
jgi:all-trans-retinol 13,14-reductase